MDKKKKDTSFIFKKNIIENRQTNQILKYLTIYEFYSIFS